MVVISSTLDREIECMRSTLFDSSEAEKLGFHAVRSPLDRLANSFLVVVDAQTQFNIS